MKVIDLTGENRVALGFHVDLLPDGGVVGRFEASKIDGANFQVGQPVPAGTPDLTELQIKFDNPNSVAVFVRSLTDGYNKMAYRILQEKVRRDALAKAEEESNSRLKGRTYKELKGSLDELDLSIQAIGFEKTMEKYVLPVGFYDRLKKQTEEAKKLELASRIEQMARDLAVLQGEYNELQD